MELRVFLKLLALALPGMAQQSDSKTPKADVPSTGTTIVLQLRGKIDSDGKAQPITGDALERAAESYRKRLKGHGVVGFSVKKEAPDRISVELPPQQVGIKGAHEILLPQARLEFREAMRNSREQLAKIEAAEAILDPAYETLPESDDGKKEERKLIVKKEVAIAGDQIKEVLAVREPSGNWSLLIQFRPAGGKKFGEITAAMEPDLDRFAIILDRLVISAPVLAERGGILGGQCTLSGRFNEKEARELAGMLNTPLELSAIIISAGPTKPASQDSK